MLPPVACPAALLFDFDDADPACVVEEDEM
jgi:hypothetical protein